MCSKDEEGPNLQSNDTDSAHGGNSQHNLQVLFKWVAMRLSTPWPQGEEQATAAVCLFDGLGGTVDRREVDGCHLPASSLAPSSGSQTERSGFGTPAPPHSGRTVICIKLMIKRLCLFPVRIAKFTVPVFSGMWYAEKLLKHSQSVRIMT